jgi:CheY-like chemotaxis protein
VNCKSILIVEDDQDIRETLEDTLREEGYVVATAANGKEAMERLKDLPPPLILLDMMMPIMNGWEFLEAQKARAEFADIRVVVLSALQEPRSLTSQGGEALPAEGLLAKPTKLENLLSVVETYCEHPEKLSELSSA